MIFAVTLIVCKPAPCSRAGLLGHSGVWKTKMRVLAVLSRASAVFSIWTLPAVRGAGGALPLVLASVPVGGGRRDCGPPPAAAPDAPPAQPDLVIRSSPLSPGAGGLPPTGSRWSGERGAPTGPPVVVEAQSRPHPPVGTPPRTRAPGSASAAVPFRPWETPHVRLHPRHGAR